MMEEIEEQVTRSFICKVFPLEGRRRRSPSKWRLTTTTSEEWEDEGKLWR